MDLANLLHGAPKRACPDDFESVHTYKRSPQPPLSPPVEEPKCSLPSITALLEGADGHAAKRQRVSPPARDARYDTVHLPPTPPLRPGSGSGNSHSHNHSSPIEAKEDHRTSISSTSSHSHSHSHSHHTHHPHHHGPYASPAPSVSSYSSPIDAPMYYRPPTATFAPNIPAQPQPQPVQTQPQPQVQTQGPAQQAQAQSPSLISPVTPAWQHHHYFPPSTATPYQQNHDRYICRTCHKAFSRPSSLRIHSHSHTGEKPFRCTHSGCGKAFSVRSNMKRHERGCHSGRAAPPAVNATTLVV